jgi:YbbR domain-containing protein
MKKRRIYIIFVATLFAVLVWVSVNMSYQYQTSAAVPLIVQNLPPGKAIKTPIPRFLQIRVRGEGWRLATLAFGSDLKFVLDVNSLTPNQRMLTMNDVSERLNMPPGTVLAAMKPESLVVDLEKYAEKRIPVMLDGVVSLRDGFIQISSPTFSPESVTVGGAMSVAEKITSWNTVYTVIRDVKSSLDISIPLAAAEEYRLSFTPSEVMMHMKVEPFAEKRFSGIPVEVVSAPSDREVILIPPKIEIVVRGGIEQLSSLTPADFRASVEYAMILSDSSGTMDIDISSPPGALIVSKKPDHLQYIIRKRL